MRTNILLPTDFSNNAWIAIEYARNLYRNENCNFYLLNAFSLSPNFLDIEPGNNLYDKARDESEDKLSKLLYKLILNNHNDNKHHFNVISAFGNAVEAIENSVEQKDIEMIVMGTTGSTKTSGISIGSTATQVIEKIRNCPVIVVPEDGKQSLPKEIVFPTGFEIHYKKRELKYVIQIAKSCNSKIAILHVQKGEDLDQSQKEHKQLLKSIFEGVDYSFYSLPNYSKRKRSHTTLESIVNLFVVSSESDMIAFINKKHVLFGNISINPFVKGVISHSKVPILVMHDLRN